MFRSILERLQGSIRTLDLLTDRMADYGVHLWHSLLYFLDYFFGSVRTRLKEVWVKFKKWFDKVTDGEYDPKYEDDIIVQMWKQRFGGTK